MGEREWRKQSASLQKDWQEKYLKEHPEERKSGFGDGCFVVTAIDFEPKLIQRFYNVRDEVLVQEFFGKMFIKIYYSGLGKRLANIIQSFDLLKYISRKILLKLLTWKEN